MRSSFTFYFVGIFWVSAMLVVAARAATMVASMLSSGKGWSAAAHR